MLSQTNPYEVIEEYKFSYLTRNLDNIEDCLDINGRLIIDKYVKKIKDKEFKNRKATIFDIVEYYFRHYPVQGNISSTDQVHFYQALQTAYMI